MKLRFAVLLLGSTLVMFCAGSHWRTDSNVSVGKVMVSDGSARSTLSTWKTVTRRPGESSASPQLIDWEVRAQGDDMGGTGEWNGCLTLSGQKTLCWKNLGEWGGSLGVMSRGVLVAELLDGERLTGVVRVGNRLIALMGLSHGEREEGALVEIVWTDGLPKAGKRYGLDFVPEAACGGSQAGVVVGTKGVYRLGQGMLVERILSMDLWGAYINSVVCVQEGVVLGARGAVLFLEFDQDSTPVPHWLVPPH